MPETAAPTDSLAFTALTRQKRHRRSLFLSDLHLGNSRGRPGHVVDFLDHVQADVLYLVGDIFDGWNPRARRAKPGADHRILLDRLDKSAADGCRIVLVPGNHDAAFRPLAGHSIGPMQVAEETHHVLANGQRLLVTHGDGADPLMAVGALAGWAGGHLDNLVRRANRQVNTWRETFGLAASDWAEARLVALNKALHASQTHADRLTTRARDLGFDGVICGHFHVPALRQIQGTTYANCGDWLDHFSAVAETSEGDLQLIGWPMVAAPPLASRLRLPAGGLPVG